MNISQFNKTIESLVIQRQLKKTIGLVNGNMGLAINVYYLSNHLSDDSLVPLAESLLEQVFIDVNSSHKIHFSTGLAGLGWAIDHLIDKKFVEGSAEQVLEDVERAIVRTLRVVSLKDHGLLDGYLGISRYYIDKLNCSHNVNSQSLQVLDAKLSLISIIDQMYLHLTSLNYQISQFQVGLLYWPEPEYIRQLGDLYTLDLFNSKIEKIIQKIEDKILFTLKYMDNSVAKLLLLSSFKHLHQNFHLTERSISFIDEELLGISNYELINDMLLSPERIRLIFEVTYQFKALSILTNEDNYLQNYIYWKAQIQIESDKLAPTGIIDNDIKLIHLLGFFDGYSGIKKYLSI